MLYKHLNIDSDDLPTKAMLISGASVDDLLSIQQFLCSVTLPPPRTWALISVILLKLLEPAKL